MSDKSVKKTLDWPNHDDQQDKPPEFGKWTSTTGPTWKRDEEEVKRLEEEIAKLEQVEETCEYCGKPFETAEERDEHEQSHRQPMDWNELDEQDQDPSQQLDPTQQQNVTPFSQGQFIPTATYGPQKGEDEALPFNPDEYILFDCPKCNVGYAMSPPEQDDVLKNKQWKCQWCDLVVPIDDVDDLIDLQAGPEIEDDDNEGAAFEPSDPSLNLPYREEGPLSDPREREKAGDVEKEPGEGLSPEAQKITGTDPESRAATQKEKPKLEVDADQKITILGKTGSGKTNLIKVLMSDILPDYHFIVLDAIGNLTDYEGQPNVEYHQTNPSDDAEIDQIIYSALEKGDCMVVIDEVDRYNSKKGTMLNELVNVGRNYGVGGIFAARRTASIDKDILANSKFIFTFQHILPQDLEVLMDWFAQPEDTFRDLQEFETILFKDGDQIWSGKVPEKPTTTPTKKPTLPKRPKGGKGPEQKGGEKGQPPADQGGEPQEKGQPPAEKEPQQKGPSDKSPDLTPADEGEKAASEKSEARYADEAPFVCSVDGTRFKYESDWEDHLVREHSYA